MQAIISFITGTLNTVAWLYIFLPCTILFGLYLTIRNRGLQFTKFGYVMKNTLGKMFQKQEAGEGAVTPMQAVSTALAATVGTGNIVGTSQAIALGGYGAIFWLWLAALLGMMVKYSEVLLAIKYRERDAGRRPNVLRQERPRQGLAVGRHLVLYLCSHRRFRYRQHVAGQLHRRLHQQRCRRVHPGRCC